MASEEAHFAGIIRRGLPAGRLQMATHRVSDSGCPPERRRVTGKRGGQQVSQETYHQMPPLAFTRRVSKSPCRAHPVPLRKGAHAYGTVPQPCHQPTQRGIAAIRGLPSLPRLAPLFVRRPPRQ